MTQECWQSVTRISEYTENRHFKGISQSPPPQGGWGLGIGHSGVTFLLWSKTLSARTPTCGTQSPGARTRAINRPLCICPTTTVKAEISLQEECPGRGRGGVLLGADVESSHQPHKSRAFFCLKPPKVPAASPVRPRPRPAPWARLVCTSPLSSLCPAAPPPPQVSRPLRPRLSHS